MFEKIKEEIETNKTVVKILSKYWVAVFMVAFLFSVGIYADFKGYNSITLVLEIIGMCVIAVFLALAILVFPDYKKYIKKIFFYAFLWFSSTVVFVDFSEINFEKILELVTCFEYIFLGCYIPDFVDKLNEIQDKQDKDKSQTAN